MSKEYILNRETSKIELHFEKAEYLALTVDQKKELKSSYLWSDYGNCWVSRSKNNHWSAIRTAEKLGFTDGGKTGERLSYAEELERKAEKAEHRAERYEQYASNAINKSERLQSDINSMRGDIAFFTQPNINSSAGRAFTRQREKMFARFEKGMEEYRKSEYFKEKATTANNTASMNQLKDAVYLDNKIKECNSNIKKTQSNIVNYEDKIYRINNGEVINSYFTNEPLKVEKLEENLNEQIDNMEYEIDKLAFFENALDELKASGRQIYSQLDIKAGYHVKIRGSWCNVLKANKTSVDIQILTGGAKGFELRYPYPEIYEMKIPGGWEEEIKTIENPFKIGDIVAAHYIGSTGIMRAYQVIKTTDKTVTIQRISIENGKPIVDKFVSDKQERKSVKKDRQGTTVVNDNNWYLYKYTDIEKAV